MLVWLSRTEPGASRAASYLEARGYQTLVAPVLEIVPTGAETPDLAAEHIIFTSEHAVLQAQVQAAALPPAGRWYAIGATTAAAAAHLQPAGSGPISVAQPATSEGLLQMAALQRLDEQRVLLITGEGGRDLLAGSLRDRGAQVTPWRVYRRRPVQALPALRPVIERLDAAVAASGDGVTAMTRFFLGAGGDAALPLCVPSQRVAAVAAEQGWQRVLVSAGADVAAVSALLATLRR